MKYPIPQNRPLQQHLVRPTVSSLIQSMGTPAQTFGRPLQNARGMNPQPTFMDRLAELSPALLQSGIGLMSGRSASEQFALGAQGFGQGIQDIKDRRQQKAQRNKTLEFLKQQNPELAAAVEAGAIPASQAFGMHWRSQTGKQNNDFDAYGFPRSGAISQKLRAYQIQGIDEEKALGLATGRYSVSINPQTGERVIVDIASGQLMPLQQPDYGQPNQEQLKAQQPLPSPQQVGLYDQAGNATGFSSAMGNASSNTFGQIPGAVGDIATFPDSVRAVQEIKLFKRDLIRSLSLNRKFPATEQQRIEGLLPSGAFTAPDSLRQSFIALDTELARIEAELEASRNNPLEPLQNRQEDARTLRDVRAARQRMAVPQSMESGGIPQVPQGGSDLKAKYGLE